MGAWFPVLLLLSGAVFTVEAALSLALGRAVIPMPRGKRQRARWEFWSQLLFGIVLLLVAASISLSSQLGTLATAVAGVASFLGFINAIVALFLTVRSAQTTDPSPR